jgi:Zn-dependent protease with chaperone function
MPPSSKSQIRLKPAARGAAPPGGGAPLPPQAQMLLAAFKGEIPPHRISFTYRLALLFAATVMLTLVAIYMLIVCVACILTVAHFALSWRMVAAADHPNLVAVALFTYLGVGFTGILITLFLMKPFLAKASSEGGEPYLLDPAKEVVFFAFVRRIAETLRAPMPERISVNLDVNAAAGYGLSGLNIFSRRLTLVVGLPLIQGMNTRELAGIIAHELGHFSQGTANRLLHIVRSVNYWLIRVAFERDEWDDSIARWSEAWGILGLPLLVARLLIWIIRKFLFLLFLAGHFACSYMLRQMEFDADRYEAILGGSDCFEASTRRLLLLELADRKSHHDLMESWKERRLTDDLCALVVDNVRHVPPDVLAKFQEEVHKEKTGWFATHPATSERIRRAKAVAAPGIFHLEMASHALFAGFSAVSREVTRRYYEDRMGKHFKEEFVQSTAQVIAHRDLRDESFKAIGRYFQGLFNDALLPLIISEKPIQPPVGDAAPKQEIRTLRGKLLQEVPRLRSLRTRYMESFEGIANAQCATTLMKADFQLPDNTFRMTKPSRAAADALYRQSHIEQRQAREELNGFIRDSETRLIAAMQLLHRPEIREKVSVAGSDPKEAEALIGHLARVGFVLDLMVNLRADYNTLMLLFRALKGNEENSRLQLRIRDHLGACNKHLSLIVQPLSYHPYPFEHQGGKVTMAEYALKEMPHPYDVPGVVHACDTLTDNVYTLYFRLLGRIVLVAEKVEQAMGEELLPEPPREKDEEAGEGD